MAAIAAYATHAPLDMLTSYGTPIFWPVDFTRISLDIMPIIDPIFTLILLIGMIAMTIRRSNMLGRLTLLIVGLYIAFAATQHNRALNAQLALSEHRSNKPDIVRVMPTPGNVLVWNSVYLASGTIYTDLIRVPLTSEKARIIEGKQFEVLKKERLYKRHKITEESRVAQDIVNFEWFAGGLVAPLDRKNNNELADMRYTIQWMNNAPLWTIKVDFAKPDEPAELVFHKTDRKEALNKLWELVKAAPENSKSVIEYYPIVEE
jgi:inner membrane protein